MTQDNARTSDQPETQPTAPAEERNALPGEAHDDTAPGERRAAAVPASETVPTPPPAAPDATAPQAAPAPGADADAPCSMFNAACRVGPLALLLLLAAQAWSSFLGGNLYCPAEAQSVLLYRESAAQGLWLAPAAGTDFAQWPGFFWLLRGLDWCFAHLAPQLGHLLFPLASVLGALLALLAVWTLGRAAGLGRGAALVGGLVLFCAPVFAPISSFTGPQALALALTLLSLACLCPGWRRERAFLLLPLGFLFAGLAGLTGGPVHLLLPLLTSLLFILWRCTLRRARGLDGLLGFVLLLLLLGGWLGCLILWQPAEGYLRQLGRSLAVWPVPAQWWKAPVMAGLGLLPWLAVPVCVSWLRVLRCAPGDLAASRREHAGAAFLWIALASACGLSLFADSPLAAALCIAGLAAPLLGKALLRLPPLGARLFHCIAALCLLCAGALLTALYFEAGRNALRAVAQLPLTDAQQAALSDLTGLPVLGGLCIVAALAAARMGLARARSCMGNALLAYAGLAVLLAQPAALLLAPQLAGVPEAQVRHMEDIVALAPSAPNSTPQPADTTPTAQEPQSDSAAPALPASDAPDAGQPAQEQAPPLPAEALPAAPDTSEAPPASAPTGPAPSALPAGTSPAPTDAPADTAPAVPGNVPTPASDGGEANQ
ncbi:MAG: hypothetical protein E7022_06335 [Desulfovibrio desulfuricans]|nr:hypothetical protein [Desulfovibrio desulfuricans]